MDNKLIILRGPSGSGKTTIARKLFQMAKNKTVLINQDYYRFIFSPAGGGTKPNSETIHAMIEHNTLIALQAGYTVILEGILSVKSYQHIIESLISSHQGESYIFYFDISFKETLKRHKTKKEVKEFGEKEMREWYPGSHKSNHERETLITEDLTEKEVFEKILHVSKLEIKKI